MVTMPCRRERSAREQSRAVIVGSQVTVAALKRCFLKESDTLMGHHSAEWRCQGRQGRVRVGAQVASVRRRLLKRSGGQSRALSVVLVEAEVAALKRRLPIII
jgi:hypothetical protein